MINVLSPDGSKYYLTGCRGRVRSIETQQIITVLPDFTAGSDRWRVVSQLGPGQAGMEAVRGGRLGLGGGGGFRGRDGKMEHTALTALRSLEG